MHIIKKRIIGILIITLIGTNIPTAYLASDAPVSPVIKACKSKAFKAPKVDADAVYSAKEIKAFYRKASQKYHTYQQCIFDESVKSIIGSSGADTEGFFRASSPNLILPELLKPDTACLAPDKLKKIITGTEPNAILSPLMGTYLAYSEFLNTILNQYLENPKPEATDENDNIIPVSLSQLISSTEEIELEFRNELEDALVGLETTFAALKEMRLAFVMHVQFQCLLGNLEKYRDMLANIRSEIMQLPFLLIDASAP